MKIVKSSLADAHRLCNNGFLAKDASEVVHFKEVLEMLANTQTKRQKRDEKASKKTGECQCR